MVDTVNHLPSREEYFHRIKTAPYFDFVVVGGGIHGACFARLAAYNGYKILLLEKKDYGWATSSRSSKMAHGGLRYLETFDFQQVFEGVKARDDLLDIAPHLVKPESFLLPIQRGRFFEKIKLEIGLSLYDLFLKNKKLRHTWHSYTQLSEDIRSIFKGELKGCFEYHDGLVNDVRLVIEHILAARKKGVVCLNYVKFQSAHGEPSGKSKVIFTDVLTDEKFECTTSLVVNCTGPWALKIGEQSDNQHVRFSQGTHVLFEREWNKSSFIIPLKEKGRYYFVWPHELGTLVGTTERELQELPEDPQPTEDEIEEILDRVSKDIPHAELTRDKIIYSFAGVRTLPARSGDPTAKLSRKHHWSYSKGMLSLIGGKLTTSMWTAFEGLQRAALILGDTRKLNNLKGVKLPGGDINEEILQEFYRVCSEKSVPEKLSQRAIGLLGSRVEILKNNPDMLVPLSGTTLLGEIKIAVEIEQAVTVEDVIKRRLCIEPHLRKEPQLVSEIERYIKECLKSYVTNE